MFPEIPECQLIGQGERAASGTADGSGPGRLNGPPGAGNHPGGD